ncbi:MAG: restriction endonuclease [Ignavibacteriaceae bacterium]|nr:restriction endonuclease [Ignavibacteriaceae bacterium]
MNYIYLGDCLNVLREQVPNESVDLIYIDPPFNSKRNYNIFFDDKEIQTQKIAFEDTWTLINIQDSLAELNTLQTHNIYKLLTTYQEVAPQAFPYLVMMGLRILELHQVLKPTGSFYLHCDPTMSHYLKTMADVVFGTKNFLNEILWKRFNFHADAKRFGTISDRILFYSKSENFIFNRQVKEYNEEYIENKFTHYENNRRFRLDNLNPPGGRGPIYEFSGVTKPWRYTEERMKELDKNGYIYKKSKIPQLIRYLDEMPGQAIPDIWDDIAPINSQAKERLGYPTQKPKALLERIINASSNEGDTVLDAFCGCGTSIDAAESLHRKWIGIDISPIAISLIKRRLKDAYGKSLNKFEVRGVPEDEPSAIRLWNENPFAFQDWWLTEFEVFSTTEGKKGADKGIDGIGQYMVGNNETTRVAFQVKGGKVQSKDIDALIGVLSKHKCELGVFLTIEPATKPMLDTVAQQGFVEFNRVQYPKVQIFTLKDFFNNKNLKLPQDNVTFKAASFKGKKNKQIALEI